MSQGVSSNELRWDTRTYQTMLLVLLAVSFVCVAIFPALSIPLPSLLLFSPAPFPTHASGLSHQQVNPPGVPSIFTQSFRFSRSPILNRMEYEPNEDTGIQRHRDSKLACNDCKSNNDSVTLAKLLLFVNE